MLNKIQQDNSGLPGQAEYEKKLLQSVLDRLEYYGGKEILKSIVLTGSFGRDEPSYVQCENGTVCLKSDVEIGLVFSGFRKRNLVIALAKQVAEEFSEELNLMPISAVRLKRAQNFNFAIGSSKAKTLFTYDLYNGSKTIWGEHIIEKIPVSLDMVDLYEAKRLVANRIGELICCSDSKNTDYLQAQWQGKLMLALGSAWLLCSGLYESSYRRQYAILAERKLELENAFGKSFFADYEKAFLFLRQNRGFFRIQKEPLLEYVKSADIIFARLKLKKPKINSLSRNLKYWVKYIKITREFGLINFEDAILQALITDYYRDDPELPQVAKIWKRVLC